MDCLPPDKRRRHGGKDINGNQHVKLVVGAKCKLYERDLRRTTGRLEGWERSVSRSR